MVGNKYFYKFEKILQEGHSYYVKSPSFAANRSKLSYSQEKHLLSFFPKTSVNECHNFQGSKTGFAFVDFKSILSRNIPVTTSVG